MGGNISKLRGNNTIDNDDAYIQAKLKEFEEALKKEFDSFLEQRIGEITPDMCSFMSPYGNLIEKGYVISSSGLTAIYVPIEGGLCYTLYYENTPIPFDRLDAMSEAGGQLDYYSGYESKGTGSFIIPEGSDISHVQLWVATDTYPNNDSLAVYQMDGTNYFVNTPANDKHIEEIAEGVADEKTKLLEEEVSKGLEEVRQEMENISEELPGSLKITPDQCTFMTEVYTPLDYDSAPGTETGMSPIGTGLEPTSFELNGARFSVSENTAYTLYFKYTALKPMYDGYGIELASGRLNIENLQIYDSSDQRIPDAQIKRIGSACFIAPEGADYVMISASLYAGMYVSASAKLIEGNPYSYYVNEEANDAHIQALIDKSIEEAIVDSWEVGV